jgi:tRNA nucleotidyltransferase (CCA-adding enzyme)
MDELKSYGKTVLERLPALPGGSELLDLSAGRDDVELVGGAARDLLLGGTPRELDVVVAGDAASFARDLASTLGVLAGEDPQERSGVALHERFGTALVWWEGGRIDIACRRGESYSAPGALPDVRAGTPEEDLRRRDFTVNAIAVPLGGPCRGELRAVPCALEDLSSARLRVLHDRSFLDDPTRLLRLARYCARLQFQPDEHTAKLAARALAAGALKTVSGARIGAELRLALGESDPVATLAALQELGVLSAVHPLLCLRESLARRALAILPADGRADLLLVATLLLAIADVPAGDPERVIPGLLDDLEFPASDRDRTTRTALLAPALAVKMRDVNAPSELREAAHGATLEAVALAACALEQEHVHSEAVAIAEQWLKELRNVRLRITGDDLLAAGLSTGPEIGERLKAVLDMRLDGELDDTREAQLLAALEAQV